MEKLSPEDISRAREWREKSGIGRFHHTAECHISKEHPHGTDYISAEEYAAAYSAAENERLTQELEQERAKTDVELEDRAEAAEAERDRLKGALRDMVVIVQQDGWHNALTGRQIVLEAAEAALRPEGE